MRRIFSACLETVQAALRILFPKRCPLCCTFLISSGLCASCWSSITFFPTSGCSSCGVALPFALRDGESLTCVACASQDRLIYQMRSVFVYNPQSRGLVLRFKHAHDFSYLSLLEEWLARYGGKLCADADYIVPVPLHWFRLGARGFNQAAVLARLLSKRFKLSYTPRILKRLRSTASQGHLSRSERMRNVQGAFQVPRSWHSRLRGKTCLLVDDVYTTGATFDACAQALRAAGASKVLALTLSRTPHARHLL